MKKIEIEKAKANCAGMLKGFIGRSRIYVNRKKIVVPAKKDIRSRLAETP